MPVSKIRPAAATTPALAENWRSSHNDRFGETSDHPANWKMEPEPANDDGRRFSSPDGNAFVIISGGFAMDSRAEEMARREKPDEGWTVTYAAKGANWIVRSGTRGDRVWNNLDIEYFAEDKAKYEKLVGPMAASPRASIGYNITGQ